MSNRFRATFYRSVCDLPTEGLLHHTPQITKQPQNSLPIASPHPFQTPLTQQYFQRLIFSAFGVSSYTFRRSQAQFLFYTLAREATEVMQITGHRSLDSLYHYIDFHGKTLVERMQTITRAVVQWGAIGLWWELLWFPKNPLGFQVFHRFDLWG